jgi:hypothetical protein
LTDSALRCVRCKLLDTSKKALPSAIRLIINAASLAGRERLGPRVVVTELLSAIQRAGFSSLQCTPSRLCTSSTVPSTSWVLTHGSHGWRSRTKTVGPPGDRRALAIRCATGAHPVRCAAASNTPTRDRLYSIAPYFAALVASSWSTMPII